MHGLVELIQGTQFNHHKNMRGFGQCIRELRGKRALTVQDVSTCLGIAPAVVSNIEKGFCRPTKNQVFTLANYFAADVKELLILYQKERMLQEECIKENETRSCLVKNRQVAIKRYENMKYELQRLGQEKFNIQVYKPGYPLNDFIESMTFYNGHAFGNGSEKVMPDGTVQLFITLNSNKRQLLAGGSLKSGACVNDAWITGIQKQYITYQLKPSQTEVSIKFHPGGFYALTNIPQANLKDQVVDADGVFGKSLVQLKEAISGQTQIGEIFKKAETCFTNIIEQRQQQDTAQAVVSYMCHNIFAPMSWLARKTGYSQKHLIHLFKEHVGVTPKYFQRIRRFNKVLGDIQDASEIDWTGIAFDNHYFDQAHFIKDFIHFSGFTPQHYIATGSTCAKFIYPK